MTPLTSHASHVELLAGDLDRHGPEPCVDGWQSICGQPGSQAWLRDGIGSLSDPPEPAVG